MDVDLQTIILAVIGSGLLNIIVNRIFAVQDKKKSENDGVIRANRLIMKDRLRYLCARYLDQNWIYEDELEDLEAMHECYHTDLLGNGYLSKLMDRVRSLEIRGIGR